MIACRERISNESNIPIPCAAAPSAVKGLAAVGADIKLATNYRCCFPSNSTTDLR